MGVIAAAGHLTQTGDMKGQGDLECVGKHGAVLWLSVTSLSDVVLRYDSAQHFFWTYDDSS